MTKEQIRHREEMEDMIRRNAALAKLLGWWQEEPNGTWFKHDTTAITVAYSFDSNFINPDQSILRLPFSSDMNYLIQVIEKLRETVHHSSGEFTDAAKVGEYFIDSFEMKYNSFYATLIQWTNKGWRMFDAGAPNRDLSILYIIGENCKDYIQGMFFFLSDIASVVVAGLPEPQNPNRVKRKK